MLRRATRDPASEGARMSWAPWHETHVAATSSPASWTAWPWTPTRYALLLWQARQRPMTLIGATADCGSLTDRTLWAPWQAQHSARNWLPPAGSRWELLLSCLRASSWQVAQGLSLSLIHISEP